MQRDTHLSPSESDTNATPASMQKMQESALLAQPESDYMNAAQRAFFKQRLLDEREELTSHLREVKAAIASHERDSDEADQASFEEELRLALHGVQHIFHPPAPLPLNSVSDRISRFVFITQNVAPATVAELYSFFTPSNEVVK
nr:hypothetical protein [Halomonas sp.]